MTAFADYLDLRTAVLEEAGRPDKAEVFPRMVLLAEARLNQTLRTRHQITEAALSFTNRAATLPGDFLAPIALIDAQGREYIQQPIQKTLDLYHQHDFAIDGTQVLGPQGDLTLHYYAKLPTLTTSVTASNWLLENYPSVYLYAVSAELAKHLRDTEAAQAGMQLLDMELRGMAQRDGAERYSRARVRVAGPTP